MFLLYTSEIESFVLSRGLRFHSYADDIQLYVHASLRNVAAAEQSITECVEALEGWFKANRLKLNCDKSEIIWFGSKHNIGKLDQNSLVIGGSAIKPVKSVRVLGVIFDSLLKFDCHIANVCRACFFFIRQINLIKECLSIDNLKCLMSSFVARKLDYCNSLLIKLPQKRI